MNTNKTTHMEMVAVEKLVPYVNNARTHSQEQITKLRSSLREFGFINPVIIDKDYGVIAGHGRLMAAKEEGITEVPCVLVRRYVEDTGDTDNVYVIRNGEKLMYSDLVKEIEV